MTHTSPLAPTALLTILLILPLLLALPTLLLGLQIAAALWPRQHAQSAAPSTQTPNTPPRRPVIAVLVPAHNEEGGIAITLDAIQRQLSASDHLLVIADNCSDRTADIALAAGAHLTSRRDPHHRGKALALAHGLRHLATARIQADILILIDADCWLGEHALDHLAASCQALRRPVQALYLMHASPSAGPARRAAAFAWRLKNDIRAQGRDRLCLPCQLTGSGMAFPAALLSPSLLEQGGLVEDLELGLALTAQGQAPAFCPQAIIHSRFPDSEHAAHIQRTRWEHGHLHLICRDAPRHLLRSLRQRDWRYLALACDLCIPPLSLLLTLSLVADGALLAVWTFSKAGWPWLLPALPLPLLLATLLAAWRQRGRDLLSARQMLWQVPAAMLRKLPLYARFLRHRQREWIASVRDRS